MSSGRLTFRDPSFSSGCMVEPLPQLRQKYGLAIADIIETARTSLREEWASSRDFVRTLQAVRDRPKVDFDALDELTRCELMRQCHRLYGHAEPAGEQLRLCAVEALAEHNPPKGGRRAVADPIVSVMVQQLVRSRPLASAEQRFELVKDALQACGVGSSDRNVRELLERASKAARERGEPLPRAPRKPLHRVAG